MSTPHHADPTGESSPPVLLLTWYVTQGYQHPVALTEIAAVTGYTVDELAADPAALTGGTGQQLTDLLIGLPSPSGPSAYPTSKSGTSATTPPRG